MDSNFYGESSKKCRTEETDIDPPKLKKARFLWEVKGNYHLREDSYPISHESIPQDEVNSIEPCGNTDFNKNSITSSSCNVSNRNVESFHEHCCVQSFLERSEKFIHTKRGESSDRSFPHDEEDETNDTNFLKWHTQQMIRYDIENKINAALEACLGESPNKYVDLDISDIVEDVESDLEIKDEGILMAIESHGLKTNDGIHREPLQASCYIDSICETPQTSASDLNKSEVDSSSSNECISDENSLQADTPNNYEINSKFWNTALSAAIYEKGLTYTE